MDIQWFERLFENMEIQSYMFRYIVLQSMGLISYASDVYRCVAAYLYNYIWMFHFYYSYEIIWLIVAFDYFTYNLMENVYQYTGYIVPPCLPTFPLGQKKTFWCRSLESKLQRLFDGSSEMEIQKIHRFLPK